MHVVSEREGDVDTDQVDDCVLALLPLTLHDGDRSWKGFSFRGDGSTFSERVYVRPTRQGEVGGADKGSVGAVGKAVGRNV
jgi:hypothetical protein